MTEKLRLIMDESPDGNPTPPFTLPLMLMMSCPCGAIAARSKTRTTQARTPCARSPRAHDARGCSFGFSRTKRHYRPPYC